MLSYTGKSPVEGPCDEKGNTKAIGGMDVFIAWIVVVVPQVCVYAHTRPIVHIKHI